MTEISTLVLVDGSSYLYRAFHALPPLVNSKGQATGAIYGVINMLRKLRKDYPTPHMAVIFDPKGKTFRDDLYPEYKAHRPSMPEDLRSQIQPLFEIIQAMGWPLIIVEGVEADDVIGTLAKSAVSHNWQVVISTGDKDMAQLVNPNVTLVNTMTNTLYNREEVIKKFGVPPELIIDYLTLVGDAVDNVPGVDKVGPKTAVKWLQEFGSLDAIMKNAANFSGKIGENLRASLDFLPLGKQLVTIKTDIELPFTPESVAVNTGSREKLYDYFTHLEFRSLLKELQQDIPTEKSEPKPQHTLSYESILTQEALATWLDKLSQAKLIAIDTETTSLNYMQAELVGISFTLATHQAAYIPLRHDYLAAPKQLDMEMVLTALKPILENPNIAKVGHNLKYDLTIFARHGINLQGELFDTMLETFLHGSTRNNLDAVALKYLDHKTTTFEDIAGKGVKQLSFNQIPLEVAGLYAAEDADLSLRLHEKLYETIESDEKLAWVFHEIEMPLVPILAKMERTGVLIDKLLLQIQSQELNEQIIALEAEAHALAEQPFNLSSPKQLQEILYQKMQIPILQKTPTGQPSTAEEILQELAQDYALPKIILQHRTLCKLKTTYTDKLPQQVDSTTGRIHTSYNQIGAITGRFSSSDPNLQNIPVRSAEGRRIRSAFIAPPGHQIISADYSQIELRIMAHLSGDTGLLNAFSQGLDIHKATAAEVLGIPLAEVTSEQRRSAKAINFGLIYGMSAFGLAKQLEIDRQAAQYYMDLYFARYPGVKTFMEATRSQARKQGYVETIFGRRMYLPDINSRNGALQKGAERAAINAPMQGTAADIIKRAMINMDRCLTEMNFKTRMIMQVHDELVFEVPDAEVAALTEEIPKQMAAAAQLDVPLVVDLGVGKNWNEAH